jgi:hypothetical protein
MTAGQERGLAAATRQFPRARWIVALRHHLMEYPRPVKEFSERIGTALVNGSWFVRRLQHLGRRVPHTGACGLRRGGGAARGSSSPLAAGATTAPPTARFLSRHAPRCPPRPEQGRTDGQAETCRLEETTPCSICWAGWVNAIAPAIVRGTNLKPFSQHRVARFWLKPFSNGALPTWWAEFTVSGGPHPNCGSLPGCDGRSLTPRTSCE